MWERFRCLATKKAAANDTLFDDDDMLGSMGLDSPQPIRRKSTPLPSDSPPPSGARSVFDDLLHGSKSERKMSQSAEFTTTSSSLKTPGSDCLRSTAHIPLGSSGFDPTRHVRRVEQVELVVSSRAV